MDLWIRSQNGEVLAKANCLQIKDKTILNHSGTNFKETLGEYQTKERALEVLDDIQNYIKDIDKRDFLGMQEANYIDNVFQMPKE